MPVTAKPAIMEVRDTEESEVRRAVTLRLGGGRQGFGG